MLRHLVKEADPTKLYVNRENGYVVFDPDVGSDEGIAACDTKVDGYNIIAMIDLDGDGVSNVRG